jgi:hypothetical protein
VQPRLERFQACEQGEYHKTHTQRGLLPIGSRYAASLWQGGGIKHGAHDASPLASRAHVYHKTDGRSAEKSREKDQLHAGDPVITYP